MAYYTADTTANSGMPIWYDSEEETLHKSLGRELIENLIKQQFTLYRVDVQNTEANWYGESMRKAFKEPVVVTARVQISDEDILLEGGIRRLSRGDLIVNVYNDHLTELGIDIVPGDFIRFLTKYYEVYDHGSNRDSNERRLGVTRKYYRTIYASQVGGDVFSGM